jgi:hypothetical protein
MQEQFEQNVGLEEVNRDQRPTMTIGIEPHSKLRRFLLTVCVLCLVNQPLRVWSNITLSELMEPTYFVPETMSVWSALQVMCIVMFQLCAQIV